MPSPEEMKQVGKQDQSAAKNAEAQSPPSGVPDRGLYRALPEPVGWLIMRGYLSTGLFFMLSGFVLAYLYLDEEGRQTVGNQEFWVHRLIRIYPLHLMVLPLMLPMTLGMMQFFPETSLWGISVPPTFFVISGGIMSLFLIQAWCPEAALSWNFATWALSAVAFFYLMFPFVAKCLQRCRRSTLWGLFWLMPILNEIPTLIFLFSEIPPEDRFFWQEFVMRTPLFWLPHFVMAIILCRLYRITRHNLSWTETKVATSLAGFTLGDLAGALCLLIAITPDQYFQKFLFLGDKAPNLILRHGLMTPLYSVLLYHLALGQGWIARFLSLKWCERFGEASFGIFILQMLAMMIAMGITYLIGTPVKSLLGVFTQDEVMQADLLELVRVGLSVAVILGLSLLSLNYIERPSSRWLKRRLGLRGN